MSEASGEATELWKWANFVILAVGLGYLIAKNLPPFFRSRTAEIQKGISEAQKIKRDAEARSGADGSAAGGARSGNREIPGRRARRNGAGSVRAFAKRPRGICEKLQQQAEQEIETAGKIARRELKSYAAKLALDLAEQRIRTRLDAATENGLVEDFVKDLGSQN